MAFIDIFVQGIYLFLLLMAHEVVGECIGFHQKIIQIISFILPIDYWDLE